MKYTYKERERECGGEGGAEREGNVDEMSEQVSKTMQQKWKTIQTIII